MRHNRYMATPDLLVAQLVRRIELQNAPAVPVRQENVIPALLLYWAVFAILATFCLAVWVMD